MKKYTLLFLLGTLVFEVKSQTITSVVGSQFYGFSGDGGPATAAEVAGPTGVWCSSSGIYFCDSDNERIRKINGSGIITTIAGNGVNGYSGDGGPATNAELYAPSGVSGDFLGDLFVIDQNTNRIRKINSSGIISTFAGNGVNGYSGDGGPATAAEFFFLRETLADIYGNVYVADGGNNVIRKINSSGIISTIAGLGTFVGGYSGDGGPASAAELENPSGIAFDNAGNIYISDSQNNRIRKINTSGIISTVAGIGLGGFTGDGGPATAAEINFPQGVTLDGVGDIFITDPYSERVREIDSNGVIFSVAGVGATGYSGDGGLPTLAELDFVDGINTNSNGYYYFVDAQNNRIRYVTGITGLTIQVSKLTNLSCYGNNGYIGIYPHGGKPPYTYSWSPGGQTTASLSGLGVGTYTVTVTDNSHTAAVQAIPIIQIQSLYGYCSVSTPIACNGGKATLYGGAGGGSSPYTYSWSPSGGTSYYATGLSVGSYTLTLTDNNGCTSTSSAIITQPNLLSVSITTNACGAQLTANPSGGTPVYTYLWLPNGYTTASVTGLSSGTYTVDVQDRNGCTASASINLSIPPVLHDSIKKANTLCNGSYDGKAKIFPYGGVSPYTYQWSNGKTTEGITGLAAGSYSCVVTDHNGCTLTGIKTVSSPLALSVTLSSTAVKCNGGSTGSAHVATLSGGTLPYYYLWSPSGGTNSTLTGASAGTYTLIVTDKNGCTTNAAITITQPSAIRDSITFIGCGTATVGYKGGTPGYNFRWTPYGGFTATATVTTIGIYTVTITDRNGCTSSTTANITCPIIKNEGPAGINEPVLCCDKDIVLYPNPNKGHFSIQINNEPTATNDENLQIEIYNILGEKVFSQLSITGNSLSISLNQPSGLYLYRVLKGDGGLLGQGKLIIQK